ncbi:MULTISPECIES: AEC family transporter [unclassified Clostridium]|uniref:AEC family transporter n=1 Tax=unclassified Clostridium TaxID=2614128 RepID=UPI0011069162|nr:MULTISPECIES: AEC family transporter [unclassified Clostridium]
MEHLIFSLNATMPIFFLMVLGACFKKAGIMEGTFVDKANQFVFKVALPVLLFEDLSNSDFLKVWDTRFVMFCFVSTLAGILLAVLLSLGLKDKRLRGEFIQASYRSSAALLGIAFIKNIYGDVGMAPLMIIGSVPLYNVMAVVILSFTNPRGAVPDRRMLAGTVMGILKNPIILGILSGMAWSLLGLKQPQIMEKTVSSLAGVATPLGLMAMGASFDLRQASRGVRAALGASAVKLVLLCAIFLPAAIYLGFRQQQLVAILVMLGSATTVSCFVMARNMGHEGVLSSSVVAITTCGSAFTLTLWLDLIRTLGLV